jgi:predicted ferric reductase
MADSDASSALEDSKRRIARSLVLAHSILVEKEDTEACLEVAFNSLDVKKDDVLDRSELTMFMQEAAKHVRLQMDSGVVEDAVDALLEDVRGSNKDLQHITRQEFFDIFRRHPDMMRVFDDESSLSDRRQSVRSIGLSKKEQKRIEKDRDEVWAHAHTHWKSKRSAIVWLLLYTFGNVFAFVYKAILYHRDEEAQAVFGECITVARGCAQALNLNACLILLPICRHFVTLLRGTKFRDDWFPFDASIEIHILIGIVIALFSTAHVCAHICDFYRFARADVNDIYALFGDKLGVIPDGIGARWKLLLKQPAAITGIIMVVCMIGAYVAIYYRRQKFNVFWYSHHLLIVMLIALCCHGIGNLLEPFQSVYWVVGPLTLYMIPRILRETKCSNTKVLDASVMDGEIISLKLEKPKGLWSRVQAGQYAFLNIPKLSRAEWHPFTLTSAPHEDHLEFAIQAVGDWTRSTRDLLGDASLDACVSVGGSSFPNIKVEGPIGASSQDFSKFPILVLIGAGIGVTPMISVVKELLKNPGQMKRTILYWTIRDQAAVEWFTSVLDDIYQQDDKNVIQIRHFLTSVKYDDRDLGAVLLHYAARSKHKHTNIDIILGRQTHHQVEVGRPVWDKELQSVCEEAKELGYNRAGIFLCGPSRMAEEVDDVSFKLSRDDPNFHFYFNKETF